jgi:hypothetical protein
MGDSEDMVLVLLAAVLAHLHPAVPASDVQPWLYAVPVVEAVVEPPVELEPEPVVEPDEPDEPALPECPTAPLVLVDGEAPATADTPVFSCDMAPLPVDYWSGTPVEPPAWATTPGNSPTPG